eukprot:6213879-Pleurochrysis_carterae.AAC.1
MKRAKASVAERVFNNPKFARSGPYVKFARRAILDRHGEKYADPHTADRKSKNEERVRRPATPR